MTATTTATSSMKIIDPTINKTYTLHVMNARKIESFVKDFYRKNYNITNFDEFYAKSKDFHYIQNALPAYINPIALSASNTEDVFKSDKLYLLDGFLRLFVKEVPDIDIMVKVYDDAELTDHDYMTLLYSFNHSKLLQRRDIYRSSVSDGVSYFFDRGVCQLLNLKFDINLKNDKCLNALSSLFGNSRQVDVDLRNFILKENIVEFLQLFSRFMELLNDTKIDDRFKTRFLSKLLITPEKVTFEHIKDFFENSDLERLNTYNREDVISRESDKAIEDFFVKYIKKVFYNETVKTKEELKKEFAKQVQKLKSKYILVNSFKMKEMLKEEGIQFYVLLKDDENMEVVMNEVAFQSVEKSRFDNDMYIFKTENGREYRFIDSYFSKSRSSYSLYIKK